MIANTKNRKSKKRMAQERFFWCILTHFRFNIRKEVDRLDSIRQSLYRKELLNSLKTITQHES